MKFFTTEMAQELVRSGLTKELLEPFMAKLTNEVTAFNINFFNSIQSDKEKNALIELIQGEDEYSQKILDDLMVKFFESNKGIEQRILDDLILEQKIQKLLKK